ncbi:MAG TPA: SPOR domain-containing protein, partial [Pseudohaliea sp.]|nr:SPOR domain-containing protein [Pseudohaliea sp.]
LLLLAVGGYGVMTERAALREEIRDLQARLATAGGPRPGAVPEAAALERLADLQGELASLAQENSALRARIGDLKGRLDAAGEDAAGENAAGEGGAATAVGERALPSRAAPEPEPEPEAAPVPEPEAPPAGESPAPATTADGRSWFVNFSSYAELGTARRRAAELSVDAGRVVVQDAVANGRTVYRVRVVGIGSREAADAIARRLAASYQLPPLWVGRE